MTDDTTTNSRAIGNAQRPEESDTRPSGSSGTDGRNAPADENRDTTELVSYRLEGEEILVPEGTAASTLKRDHDISDAAVLTFRDEDGEGIDALNDDDVVTDRVPPETELHVQPLAESEVFGRR